MERLALFFALFLVWLSFAGCSSSDGDDSATQIPGITPEAPSATPVPAATQIVWADFPLGTTCQIATFLNQKPSPRVSFGDDPFCLVWRDAFTNETGFRVLLEIGGQERSFVMPPNTNEFFPGVDLPKDFSFRVYALLPTGEFLVDGMAFNLN